jgi:hypothetical protein
MPNFKANGFIARFIPEVYFSHKYSELYILSQVNRFCCYQEQLKYLKKRLPNVDTVVKQGEFSSVVAHCTHKRARWKNPRALKPDERLVNVHAIKRGGIAVFIPNSVWNDDELELSYKFVYHAILTLCGDTPWTKATTKEIAALARVSTRQACSAITRLAALNHIEKSEQWLVIRERTSFYTRIS